MLHFPQLCFEEAESCYKEAIKQVEDQEKKDKEDHKRKTALYETELGILREMKGKYNDLHDDNEYNYELYKKGLEDALCCYQNAKEKYHELKYPVFESQVDDLISHAASIKKIIEGATVNNITRLEGISAVMLSKEMANIEGSYYAAKSRRKGFIREKHRLSRSESPKFYCFQRWNSITPVLSNTLTPSKGGGYFISDGSYGIVIDPGFDFIRNFHEESNFTFTDIDAIVLSHAHNDHTADLESIISLLHDYNEEEIKGNEYSEEWKYTVYIELLKDNPLLTRLELEKKVNEEYEFSPRRKHIDIYLTAGVLKKCSFLKLDEKQDYTVHVVDNSSGEDSYFEIGDHFFRLYPIKAKHYDLISDSHCCGYYFVYEKDGTSLIYTADTGFDTEVSDTFKKIKEKIRLQNNRVTEESKIDSNNSPKIYLLAHIGGFKNSEQNKFKENIPEDAYYKTHLGRLGLFKIHEIIKPDICMISEFGEEFQNGRRIELSNLYQKHCAAPEKQYFIPIDIGFVLDFNGYVKAIVKDVKVIVNDVENNDTFSFISCNEVSFIELEAEYGFPIYYYRKKSQNRDGLYKNTIIKIAKTIERSKRI
jgi:metal-dependent hydrolase (beta-lactamase superfamily II)